jgi:FAD/FMN-containing dehydrogenase
MTFTVSDIILSAQPGSPVTWVSFPYAAGAPAIMRNLDGRWDKMASAWGIPNARVDDLRKRLPQIAKMVFLQQEIDRSNGRTPKPSPTAPAFRSAAAAVPVAVVGDDWIKLPVHPQSARRALEDIGCCAQASLYFAPDQDIADQALAVIQSFVEADQAAADRIAASRAALAESLRREGAAKEDAEAQVRTARLDAMEEIRAAWPTARFVKIESRTLDGRGSPWVRITTPSGKTVYAEELVKSGVDRISRRVTVEWMKAPVFPAGSGFTTEVETTSNGKPYQRKLANHTVTPAEPEGE